MRERSQRVHVRQTPLGVCSIEEIARHSPWPVTRHQPKRRFLGELTPPCIQPAGAQTRKTTRTYDSEPFEQRTKPDLVKRMYIVFDNSYSDKRTKRYKPDPIIMFFLAGMVFAMS